MFDDIYKGKKVLVTGHCGFKGSWIFRWLEKLGAIGIGYGHRPRTVPNHFQLLYPQYDQYRKDDLLDFGQLTGTIDTFKPDLVIHLAAKAIVARTFHEPRETFENNVMGTVNLLEACRLQQSVKGIVMVTSDKVYSNKEWDWGYRENDELDGEDPYSVSKVCIEHIIKCYRTQFFPMIATARAGNVIGGGDWAEKRLIPDIARATAEGREVEIHTPNATRPWQHTLEPLSGYLMLGQKLLEGKQEFATNWNFGPEGEMTVLDILKVAQEVWPKVRYVVKEEETHPSMTILLRIDSTEARKILKWKPQLKMNNAVRWAVEWYRDFYEKGQINTDADIRAYECLMELSKGK